MKVCLKELLLSVGCLLVSARALAAELPGSYDGVSEMSGGGGLLGALLPGAVVLWVLWKIGSGYSDRAEVKRLRHLNGQSLSAKEILEMYPHVHSRPGVLRLLEEEVKGLR